MNNVHKKKSISGAAIVEFAILFPVLVMLLFGITEFGRALYQKNMLTQALAAGSRYIARYPGITCGSENAPWGTAEADAINIIMYGTKTAGTEAIIPNITGAMIHINSFADDDTSACVIEITTDGVPFAGVFGTTYSVPLSGIGMITIEATTQERYIGS